MSELIEYYERLYQVILSDMELMLTDLDPTKRSPKIILEYLKMAQQCEEQLASLQQDQSGWETLSREAQEQITEIIEKDRAKHETK